MAHSGFDDRFEWRSDTTWEVPHIADFDPNVHETELLAAFDAGEFVPVADKSEFDVLRAAASAPGTRDRRVSIRISTADVRTLKALALREGIPYQTLIASVLHKYVTGRLIDRG